MGIIHAVSLYRVDVKNRYDIHGIIELFKSLGVSAHDIIDRDGTIYNILDIDRIAYHAGKSKWKERSWLNNYSYGIELIGPWDGKYLYEGFTDKQYESLCWRVSDISSKTSIKHLEDWLGHSEVSGPDVRPDPKGDPGPEFDWERFRKGVK